jgi:predicted glycogen debranching enzyme
MAPIDLAALPFEASLEREWLCVNHLGGYAASTVLGLNTRKYHGLLVAAMAPPVRRMVILSRVEETVLRDGWSHPLSSNEYPGVIHPGGHQYLKAFDADPFPRWAYQGEGWTIEKQLRLLRGENTLCLSYVLLASDRPLQLQLNPLFALRGIHELMYQWNGRLTPQSAGHGAHRIPPTARTPEVFFAHDGEFEPHSAWYLNTIYRREEERGYAGLEDLWMPGAVRWTLTPGQSVHFACSTDPVALSRVVSEAEQQYETGASAVLARQFDAHVASNDAAQGVLHRAADQFLLPTPGPSTQHPWASVIAAYPWAAPSGRAALIALPGLFLVSGKIAEARIQLQQFIASLRDGLMPAELPEDGSAVAYTAADTSLWFVHAAHQYLCYNPNDIALQRQVLAALLQIIHSYRQGTGLGIRVGADGLVRSGAPGIPTTWMNAKTGDHVITPRAGKPVELNALWYNALCVGAELAARLGQPDAATELTALAAVAKTSFNEQFWNPAAACCHDVVCDEGPSARPDASIRPNQIFALSLPFAVLEASRHPAVLDRLRDDLLTPVGLRSLAPSDPHYRGRYAGDVVARDQAYHNGSAFPWLLGPFVTAMLRVHGRADQTRRRALELIQRPLQHLQQEGVGQLCELFDGDAPHRPGGALASACAVAEIGRPYLEEILDHRPAPLPAPPVSTPAISTMMIVPPLNRAPT